ncbi:MULTISPECIES: hypothetical protein [unclassified Streptomyces]|uniref:hypothetical protein n=1 Tax=unclassified Streptomyces TaxID=2593676 RepID=UPI002E1719D4|nr:MULTISPECIES: hypothetical protein [unclassified Streptomyces]
MRGLDVECAEVVGDGRFGAAFLADGRGGPDEPDGDAVFRGVVFFAVVFFGVGFLGPGFAELPEAGAADFGGDFFAAALAAGFVAAFHVVPQTQQDVSFFSLLVSH